VLLYGFMVMTLWYAPVYGWLFLVSGWSKRAPFLWAVLLPLSLGVAEKVAFGSSMIGQTIMSRLGGGIAVAFSAINEPGPITLDQIAPRAFFTTPDVWAGLLAAIGLFAASIRLRRFRGPL